MPWVDYRELRHRLEMEEVLTWMQWHANERRGEYLRGRCPFCGPVDTPNGRSFVVHVGRKLFKCFRCNLGGNVLDLWSRYRKMELNVAAIELCKLLHDHPNWKSSNQESQPPWTQI